MLQKSPNNTLFSTKKVQIWVSGTQEIVINKLGGVTRLGDLNLVLSELHQSFVALD